MLRYNFRLRAFIFTIILLIVTAIFIIFTLTYQCEPLPNDGKLKLVDGENVIVNNDGYCLDLKEFANIGETQYCTFVFENQNSASSHTFVTINYDTTCFDCTYNDSFTVKANNRIEYVVAITMINYPSCNNIPLSINFKTTYM